MMVTRISVTIPRWRPSATDELGIMMGLVTRDCGKDIRIWLVLMSFTKPVLFSAYIKEAQTFL